jgi:CHAT domain-containing protein
MSITPNVGLGVGNAREESNALETIRTLGRRGNYADAAAFGDALPVSVSTRPAIALARIRNRMRQGRMKAAGDIFAETDLKAATAGPQLILTMEKASLRIYQEMAIREALVNAKEAQTLASVADIQSSDRAEAERVYIRIQLIAAVYYETDPDMARQALDRLPQLAETLEQAGCVDESFAARLTFAEQIKGSREKLEVLAALATRAQKANRLEVAGEAHLEYALQMLAAGDESTAIRARLDIAEEMYAAAKHVYGPLDVHRVRARLAIEREFATAEILEACLEQYRNIDYPSRTISVLLDLSQLAHERGDTGKAAAYRQQFLEVADEAGMGLARDSGMMAQIDLLMRSADYGRAIELCQAAIAAKPPLFSSASYEQLLSAAYGFVNDRQAAQAHAQRALEGYTIIGAIDSASDLSVKVASDIAETRQDQDFQAATTLLREWLKRDTERGRLAAAISKRELLAQIDLNQFSFSPTGNRDPSLILIAEQEVAAAEEEAAKLQGIEAAKRLGTLRQIRGQIAQARGDEHGNEQCWREALSIYEKAGLAMEAANCRFLVGVIRLNRANQDLSPHFGESEKNLREALQYYGDAGMRDRAADTRFMLAQLYLNAALRVDNDLGFKMLEAAISHLTEAEADYDTVRSEFVAGTLLDAQVAKRTLVKRSSRIYDLALQILTFRQLPIETWEWVQRAKARALGDAMGFSSAPPAQLFAEVERNSDSLTLVMRERELVTRLAKSAPDNRIAIRRELAELQNIMSQDRDLTRYLELRTGTAINREQANDLLQSVGETSKLCVCIDWFAVKDRLWLVALRPGGVPEMRPLGMTLSKVNELVANLNKSFRQILDDEPELLADFNALIAPLVDLSQPEELLILSPTGPLHALPLHALEINGKALLQRNPVVYTSSLTVLRHCMLRRNDNDVLGNVALLGDPNGDRPAAGALVDYLASKFNVAPMKNHDVTRAALGDVVSRCDLVHFQGHAMHDTKEPLNSYLQMADGTFTAAEAFTLPNFRAKLIVLAACESATNKMEVGDEPLGLIPALLYAGAGAVLATLWRVNAESAAETMRCFYDVMTSGGTIDKAFALRTALLSLAKTRSFATPYHWAPFALYGDWR